MGAEMVSATVSATAWSLWVVLDDMGSRWIDKAITAAGIAISLVMRIPAPLKPIADQVIQSASSVPANIAEGAGRSGRDRMHHWRIAYGSAKEVDTHLRLLVHTNALDATQTEKALSLFDDVRALTWRLLHPKI